MSVVNDREYHFNEHCRVNYIRSITDNTHWEYIHRDLYNRIGQSLKNPFVSSPFRLWIQKRGFHLDSNGTLCVRVLDGEDSVTKLWKQVAIVEDFFDIIGQYHVHCDTKTTFNMLNQIYHGIPFEAVELFISTCPTCLSNKDTTPINTTPIEATPIKDTPIEATPIKDTPIINNKKEIGKFMKKGQIELLSIEDNFLSTSHIGLYVDTWSNYHVIFPVNSTGKGHTHYSVSLVKRVYPYFGVPSTLISTMGTEFVDDVIENCIKTWPDAAIISNGCKRHKIHNTIKRRAEKTKLLITRLLEGCGQDFENIKLSLTATEDFILSIQYKLNMLLNKKTGKCPYEIVYGQLPVAGPHTQQLLNYSDNILINHSESSESSDGEEERRKGSPSLNTDADILLTMNNNACFKLSDSLSDQVMINRISQKVPATTNNSNSGGNISRSSQQQQIQQMLAAGTIHAQEQQVTSLRELLRQEENRLEVLKQMRSTPSTTTTSVKKIVPSKGTVRVTGVDSSNGGVIRTTHGMLTSTSQDQSNGTPISTRLQQLVDSVAVNQISSQANQIKNSLQQSKTRTIQPKASSLTIPQNGLQKIAGEADEATILRTIENSSRYREFLIKQSNLRRNFQKQIDKKIGSAPYPKTFRQVWPLIPVQDNNFVKNIGLETVTLYFDPSYRKPATQPSKIKPTCNQCGCDFASAWQIRKNNSKQVLLCESCDFTNLKLFQRSKLATQLNELMESVQKEEQKLKEEFEEAKKQTVAIERAALVNPLKQPTQNSVGNIKHTLEPKPVRTVMTNGGSLHSSTAQITMVTTKRDELARKRKSVEEQSNLSKVTKTTSSNLDHTLNKISQQLIRKQVDEKVGKRHTPSPTPRVILSKTKGPPPLKQVSNVNKTTLSQPSVTVVMEEPMSISTPPPLINSISANDSRRSRRKGTPRHKLMD